MNIKFILSKMNVVQRTSNVSSYELEQVIGLLVNVISHNMYSAECMYGMYLIYQQTVSIKLTTCLSRVTFNPAYFYLPGIILIEVFAYI